MLVHAVIGWARERGLVRLRLWAPEANTAALTLYHRMGFTQTAHHRPLPTNPSLQIVELERELIGHNER